MSTLADGGATIAYLPARMTGTADPPPHTRRPRSIIRHLAMTRWDDVLRCTVSQGIGYRLVCDCGERGPVRRTVEAARADKRQHDAEHDPRENDAA